MVVGQNHNATNPIPVSERPHYRQQTVPTVPTVQTNPTSDLTINYPKIEQIQKATNLLPCDNLAHFTCDSYPFATTTCLPLVQLLPFFLEQSVKYRNEFLYRSKFILSGLFILLNLVILTVTLVITYKVGPFELPIQYTYSHKEGAIRSCCCVVDRVSPNFASKQNIVKLFFGK